MPWRGRISNFIARKHFVLLMRGKTSFLVVEGFLFFWEFLYCGIELGLLFGLDVNPMELVCWPGWFGALRSFHDHDLV